MAVDLRADDVASRFAELRALYVAETLHAAHVRLAREQPREELPFPERVARSLAELRALCELARTLHASRDRG